MNEPRNIQEFIQQMLKRRGFDVNLDDIGWEFTITNQVNVPIQGFPTYEQWVTAWQHQNSPTNAPEPVGRTEGSFKGRTGLITKNDILDLHNALEGFSGDWRSVWGKES